MYVSENAAPLPTDNSSKKINLKLNSFISPLLSPSLTSLCHEYFIFRILLPTLKGLVMILLRKMKQNSWTNGH